MKKNIGKSVNQGIAAGKIKGNVTDLSEVIQNDAEGIGLFRREFLFIGRDTCPTEEEQFIAYKQAAETMAGLGNQGNQKNSGTSKG